jgi:hypothetical protein
MPTEEFGWVYKSPEKPSKECRWCGTGNVLVNGVAICAKCDRLQDWPNGPQVVA